MKKITILLTLLIVFAFNSTNAQTEISADKQKAIQALIKLVNQDNSAEELIRAMTIQFSSMNREIIKATLIDRKDLTPTEKASLEKTLITDTEKYQQKLNDKLLQKLDYNKMIDEISAIVYDKFYSLDELNDLITFYKTPTGQKSLKIMQPMMLETMELTQVRLTPKLIAVIDELREEQKQVIAKRVDELSPRKAKTKNK